MPIDKKALHILKKLNPDVGVSAIKVIIAGYLSPLNKRLARATIININIKKLGTFRTHGHKKKKLTKGVLKYQKRYQKKVNRAKKEIFNDNKLIN